MIKESQIFGNSPDIPNKNEEILKDNENYETEVSEEQKEK